jgi:hypothetical protein
MPIETQNIASLRILSPTETQDFASLRVFVKTLSGFYNGLFIFVRMYDRNMMRLCKLPFKQ